MINFTIGPVQANEEVRSIGFEQVPYFRTPEFSQIMLESEQLVLQFAVAPADSRCVFLTGSGTASMEATVMNTLTKNDKALVIDGGSFGHRFVEILELHEIPYETISLAPGQQITEALLNKYNPSDYTAFLVNIDETSTGILYDIELISAFCSQNNLFLIVDAISSFLADDLNMEKYGVDVMITGSQKALACPPGISLIVLSPRALKRVSNIKCTCMYLDLQLLLKNMERGQTPFTPAVGTLLQIHARLKQIEKEGGAEQEVHKTRHKAEYFRSKIKSFPFEIVAENCSNAVTALWVEKQNADVIFKTLKDEYNIWVCPNGGELNKSVFRVGHIGELSDREYDTLIQAMNELQKRGVI